MRQLAALLALAAFTFALVAGCASQAPGTAGEPAAPTDIEAPTQVVASHGAAVREDSAVTVGPTVNPVPGYTARQTVKVHNSVAGFPGAVAAYATPGGGLTVKDGDKGRYDVQVDLVASGLTEQAARDALATLHVDVTDAVQSQVLHIGVAGRMDNAPAQNVGNVQRSISMAVRLDPALRYALDASSSGGGLSLAKLGGNSLRATSSGGGLDADGLTFDDTSLSSAGGGLSAKVVADKLTASSSGGGMDVKASARTADLSSAGGGMDVDATPTATGSWDLSSGGGGLTVKVARASGTAYDVTAASGGGGCSISIHDAETQGSGSDKHATSSGFAGAAIQATFDASSGGGGISVHD